MYTFVGLDFAIHLKCKNKNIKLYTKNNTQNKYIKQNARKHTQTILLAIY